MRYTVYIHQNPQAEFVGQLGACSIFGGTKHTVNELKGFLRAAGWPDITVNSSSGVVNLIDLMAAVGMKESLGYDGAMNICGEHSIGLWQVNRDSHSEFSEDELKDPQRNAQVALSIYNSQGLRAWGAYTDGGYKNYLSSSQAAPASDPGTPAAAAPSVSAQALALSPALLILLLVFFLD